MHFRNYLFSFLFLLILLAIPAQPAQAFSVLSHQAIIDVTWEKSLVPVLKKRFPEATEEELLNAHAFAYGGSIIQDMGYYPFGAEYFSDLTHYVRSGDFIQNMLTDADNLNEYAFAIGALSHYYADIYGHSIATNKSVPLVYPKVKAKHGDNVAYYDDPLAHLKMEFGYDVLQLARGNYAPEKYRDFIGFEVAKDLLERSFRKTYGLELKGQFFSLKLAIIAYRRSVSRLIPNLTKAAWRMKGKDIQEADPSVTRSQFEYRIDQSAYHKTWEEGPEELTFGEEFLALMFRLLPKIGPQRAFSFKPPTPEAEALYMQAFNATVTNFTLGLQQLAAGKLVLPNIDLDNGHPVKPGDYELADDTYSKLLKRLDKCDLTKTPGPLRQDILAFYRTVEPPKDRKERKKWHKTQQRVKELDRLQHTETP